MSGDDEARLDARDRFAVIGEIAAEVAHELRNALQVITASAYVARQDPQKSLPHILKIEKNARLAHGIVDDLMSLARGEPTRAEPVLLYDIVVAARTEMEPGAAHWEDAIEPSGLRVRAHLGLATRLFHVLFENAIHACGQKKTPTITTRAKQENGKLVIEVSDDGPGVPADIAPKIFDPLVTGRDGGTGLGLSLARRIAAAHAGSLSLVETGRDTGATFRIVFPG
ncbi:MAG TPA: HAMP domain-containing sensor histidine kinase [Polyangiaceae bacterium]